MNTTSTTTDVRVAFGDFAATEVRAEAVTAAARERFAILFGAGAVSITLPKSQAERFAEHMAECGLSIG